MLGDLGLDIARSFTIAPTGLSPAISASRISRRCTSATALKTSDVVAALAMPYYIPVSAYVEHFGMTEAAGCAIVPVIARAC